MLFSKLQKSVNELGYDVKVSHVCLDESNGNVSKYCVKAFFINY